MIRRVDYRFRRSALVMREKLKYRWKVKYEVNNKAHDQSMDEIPAEY
jgi:hypothetical protein